MNNRSLEDAFEATLEDLRSLRDEIRVQLHLGKADLKDEWEEMVEGRWEDLQKKAEHLAEETEETAKDLQSDLNVVAEELGDAYRRIRDRLKKD